MRRRAVGLASLAAALVLGHLVTTYSGAKSDDPFIRSVQVGETAHLGYADLEVTRVAPAKRLVGPLSISTAVQASDVFVVAIVAFTPTTEPQQLLTTVLVDDQDRVYRVSGKAECATAPQASTAVTTYVMLCFDLPSDRLEGLHLQLARGDLDADGTRRDEVAAIDLEIDKDTADDWAATTDDYQVLSSSIDPLRLEEADIVEEPSS